MNKTYIILMTIAATILLILKITNLKDMDLNILTVLEILFYIFILIFMSFSFIKINREKNN